MKRHPVRLIQRLRGQVGDLVILSVRRAISRLQEAGSPVPLVRSARVSHEFSVTELDLSKSVILRNPECLTSN